MIEDTIILVDDDKADQEIMKQAIYQTKIKSKLIVLNSGEEFLSFIKKEHNYPSLILLDLNMPKISGKDVLKRLTDKQIKSKIIIILTTSNNEDDINFCYQAGVKSFITKPSTLKAYNKMVENISNYWFNNILKKPC